MLSCFTSDIRIVAESERICHYQTAIPCQPLDSPQYYHNPDRKTVVKSIAHRPLSSRFGDWFSYPRDSIYNQGRGWKTAHSKLYLSPLAIWERHQKPDELIGLRFGKETNYFLIDIDAGSHYHNEDGLQAVKGAMEDIGIPETVLIRSSHSGGWHLYGFLPEKVGTFGLAVGLVAALVNAGLEVRAGQLETFPNVKSYVTDGFSLYNGHRLPLQPCQGSYLLDGELLPYSDSVEHFLKLADRAADAVDLGFLTDWLETARQRQKKLRYLTSQNKAIESNLAQEWRKALEGRLEEGFSAFGQTNDLVRDVVKYLVVFGGLEGEELREKAHALITAMPGYRAYCRHRGHIQRRINDWAKATESKGYYLKYCNFPERYQPPEAKPKGLTNDEKVADAMGRVSDAVAALMASGQLPEKVGERRRLIAKLAHCSESTLAKPNYLPLWHPSKLVLGDRANLHTERVMEDRESLDHTPPMKCGADLPTNIHKTPALASPRVVADKVPQAENLTETKFALIVPEMRTTDKSLGAENAGPPVLTVIQGGRANRPLVTDEPKQTSPPLDRRIGLEVRIPALYPLEVLRIVEIDGSFARLEGPYGFEWQALSDLEVVEDDAI
jgi:hypothetical protein